MTIWTHQPHGAACSATSEAVAVQCARHARVCDWTTLRWSCSDRPEFFDCSGRLTAAPRATQLAKQEAGSIKP